MIVVNPAECPYLSRFNKRQANTPSYDSTGVPFPSPTIVGLRMTSAMMASIASKAILPVARRRPAPPPCPFLANDKEEAHYHRP